MSEDDDPCNLVDDDGNGVVDDADSCWQRVYLWQGDHDVDRCFGLSSESAPAACPEYRLSSREPAFVLPSRAAPDHVALHQCSLGDDHVLVPEQGLPWFVFEAPVEAWEATRYDCSQVLGYVSGRPVTMGRNDLRGSFPITRHYEIPPRVATDAIPRRWFALGDEPLPQHLECDPSGTLWGFTDGTPRALRERCDFLRCEPRPSGRVIASSKPTEGYVAMPEEYIALRWTFENTGPIEWPMTYQLRNTRSPYSLGAWVALDRAVPVGGTIDIEVDIGGLSHGLDLVAEWRLVDDQGYQFAPATFTYDILASSHAAHATVAPGPGNVRLPGDVLDFEITLENAGYQPWPVGMRLERRAGAMSEADVIESTEEVRPRDTWLITLHANVPTEAGDAEEAWALFDPDGLPVPIDGAAVVRLALRANRGASGKIVAEAYPTSTAMRAGTPLLRAVLVENVGDTPWNGDWMWRRAGLQEELSSASLLRVNGTVAHGERTWFAMAMRLPFNGDGWRKEAWSLFDPEGQRVPLSRDEAFVPEAGEWLWTALITGEPCANP